MEELQIRDREERRQLWRKAVIEDFPRFHSCYTDVAWLLEQSEVVQHMSDSVQGCLSLSATSTNILMWSHYARHHTGFVVGFHANHEYFGPTVSPVEYTSTRPEFNPLEARHDGEIFYTKSEHWRYEQEYRKYQSFVEPIRLANGNSLAPYQEPTGKRQPNDAIILFPFPPECIARVIVGWKSSPALHAEVVSALGNHGLGHVPVLYALPSPTKYEMEILSERPKQFQWPPQP